MKTVRAAMVLICSLIACMPQAVCQRAIAEGSFARVDALVVNCPENIGQAPALQVKERAASYEVVAEKPVQVAARAWEFSFNEAPGTYYIAATGQHYCTAIVPVTVLAGRARHLTLVMQPGITYSERSDSLAGTLPSDGVGVSLVSEKSHRLVEGIVDQGAYYFEGLASGRYTLRILLYGRLYIDIPVDVGAGLTIRNLNRSDLMRSASLHTLGAVVGK